MRLLYKNRLPICIYIYIYTCIFHISDQGQRLCKYLTTLTDYQRFSTEVESSAEVAKAISKIFVWFSKQKLKNQCTQHFLSKNTKPNNKAYSEVQHNFGGLTDIFVFVFVLYVHIFALILVYIKRGSI